MEAVVSTNDVNNCSVSELNYLRESIENMNKFNQLEVLKILRKHEEITLNENKYGIHINLSELKDHVLNELSAYIQYVNAQEITLNVIEKEKEVVHIKLHVIDGAILNVDEAIMEIANNCLYLNREVELLIENK